MAMDESEALLILSGAVPVAPVSPTAPSIPISPAFMLALGNTGYKHLLDCA
jgi:hypothetical protein